MNKKKSTRANIVEYMLHSPNTSKVELARELNLSMPTVLSNVNELMELGLIIEVGECESTGGRKAKSIGLAKNYRCAMGLNITANHIGMVFVNLYGEVEKQERKRFPFTADISYFSKLEKEVSMFLSDVSDVSSVLGIGVALPGIINKRDRLLIKSHALGLENYGLGVLEQVMPLPVYFENDANAAMLAENLGKEQNAVYLSLNNTVGGAVCFDGHLFEGQDHRAGEFGHIVLVPGGKQCYCGKMGCADAYCSANTLSVQKDDTPELFMERLKRGEPEALKVWETYLEYLAVLISNLRMAYDTDIILGGDVGGFLSEHMLTLGEKVMHYNLFDDDLSYLKACTYNREAAAIGAAKYFFDAFIREL